MQRQSSPYFIINYNILCLQIIIQIMDWSVVFPTFRKVSNVSLTVTVGLQTVPVQNKWHTYQVVIAVAV